MPLNPENKTDPATAQNPETPEVVNDQEAGDAKPVDASRLVAEDSDRPVADNRLPPPVPPESPQNPQSSRPDDPTEPKKRGRPKMSDEEKARKRQERAGSAGNPIDRGTPSFADIGARGAVVAPLAMPQARDYVQDVLQIFVPVSMGLSTIWGEHWGVRTIKVERDGKATIDLEFTDDQKMYIKQLAAWFEYEKFGPVSPRIGAVLGTVMYAAPRFKTEPTPERIKKLWRKLTDTVGGWFGRKRRVFRQEKPLEKPEDSTKEEHAPE